MKNEDNYVIVRSGGKVYFGHMDDSRDYLLDVVELIVTMNLTSTGVQKRVVVMGLDYNSGPLKRLSLIEEQTVGYRLTDMSPKDKDALIQDYEAFCARDNLIQTPKKPVLQ